MHTNRFFFTLLVFAFFQINLSWGQPSASVVPLSDIRSSTIPTPSSVCNQTLARGQYIIVENFFKNYDYAFRRVAMLRANGWPQATLLHTDCQSFDVEDSMYLVVLSPVVDDKNELYPLIEEYWKRATENEVDLNNTRIAHAK